jgi:GntR family transcriptional repressor for pyruvate dehydrogenase complex
VSPESIRPPRLRQPRLAEIIADRFQVQIAEGSLRPGDRIGRQEAIAAEFGVSLTVVREALRVLEAQGMITVHRGRKGGASVRAPLDNPLLEALKTDVAVRGVQREDQEATVAALDGLCGYLVTSASGRAALVRRLNESVNAQALTAEAEPRAFQVACRNFHLAIVEASGLATLASILETVELAATGDESPRKCTAQRLTLRSRGVVLRHHRAAVQAIEDRDCNRAARAVSHGFLR